MFRSARFAMLAVAAMMTGSLAVSEEQAKNAEKKSTVVELDSLKSQAPADWKEETIPEQLRRFRKYQFLVPKAKDDLRDAELIIYYFGPQGGGTPADNIRRWKGFFIPPEGKNIDDVSKETKMKIGASDVIYFDVHGTSKFKERPFDPNAKEERRPNYRMKAIIFETAKGPYYFRLVGPAKTIEEHRKAFDDFLKAFK